MGEHGVSLYLDLEECGIAVDFFADRDPQKQKQYFTGIICKSYEELVAGSKDIVLIVAITEPDALMAHFRKLGFQCVMDEDTAFQYLTNGESRCKRKVVPNTAVLRQMKDAVSEWFERNDQTPLDELLERINEDENC